MKQVKQTKKCNMIDKLNGRKINLQMTQMIDEKNYTISFKKNMFVCKYCNDTSKMYM